MSKLPDWLDDSDRRFFEQAVPLIKKRARKHRLHIEAWFKDTTLWAMHFRHPLGGMGQIVVGQSDGCAEVSGLWWRDDFDAETRYMSADIKDTVETAALSEAIEKLLAALLALTDHDLVAAHKMPPGTWHQNFTEESFSAWERSLSFPKP